MKNPTEVLRKFALTYPETEEGVACAGTALETRTIKVRKKAFLFLGTAEIRLKLSDSLAEATQLAAKEPSRYSVGANGWVKASFDNDTPPPAALLQKWIDESYRLFAPKQLVSGLEGTTGEPK